MLIYVFLAKDKDDLHNCRVYAFVRNEKKAIESFCDYKDKPYFLFISMDGK